MCLCPDRLCLLYTLKKSVTAVCLECVYIFDSLTKDAKKTAATLSVEPELWGTEENVLHIWNDIK